MTVVAPPRRRRLAQLLAALAMFGPFSIDTIFPAFPANELRAELDRWAVWHWVRSGLSLVALTAAFLAAWQ